MIGRPLCSLGAAALVACFVSLSCQGVSERQLSREGYAHAPSEYPLAWLASDRLAVLHLDEWRAGSASQRNCDSSGVYLLDATGRSRGLRFSRELCDVPDASGLDVSSDGRYIVYSGGGELHRLDLQNGGNTPLTGASLREPRLPSWSPAGQRIAFVAQSAPHDSAVGLALYLVNSDGTSIRQVRSLGARYVESSPSWSPDRQRLLVTAYPDGGRQPETPAEIVVFDTLGQNWSVLARGHQATWSPTGEWIAFLSFSRAGTDTAKTWASSIRLMRPDGTDSRELFRSTEGAVFERFRDRIVNGSPFGPLVWSVNGKRLAFRRIFKGRSTVWAINDDGSGLTELSRADGASVSGR